MVKQREWGHRVRSECLRAGEFGKLPLESLNPRHIGLHVMVPALLIGEQTIFPLGIFPADAGSAEVNNGGEILSLLDRGRLIADNLHHLTIEPGSRQFDGITRAHPYIEIVEPA